MEITQDARVYTAHDEYLGKTDRIVVDPVTRKLSHIVIHKGVFFPEDKVIPVTDIATATAERINLATGIYPADYPPFEERHYLLLSGVREVTRPSQPAPSASVVPSFAWYGQHGVLPPPYESYMSTVAAHNIPENAVTIEPGSLVIAHDEVIGEVAEVLATDDGTATHIVLKDGGLSSIDRAIPITFVDRINEGSVRLAVDGTVVASLPPYTRGSLEMLAGVDENIERTVHMGGRRLQAALSDVADLILQIQHLRWNLSGEVKLRSQLDDFDALVRVGADSIARRLREMGVAPDGRVNTVHRDRPFDPLPAGPLDGGTVIEAFSRRLTQVTMRLQESVAVLEQSDPESHKVLQLLSEEILLWIGASAVGR